MLFIDNIMYLMFVFTFFKFLSLLAYLFIYLAFIFALYINQLGTLYSPITGALSSDAI